MADLNYILQDQSSNDKLLVKELSVYIKNHRDKKKPIDKKLMLDIIKIIQSNDEDLSLDNIIFLEDKRPFLGQCGDKEMYLYINNLNAFYRRSNLCADRRLLAYQIILETILHEFTHAKQEFLIKEKGINYYKSSFELCDSNFDVYLDNYLIIPIERLAEIRGSILAYEVLSYIYKPSSIKMFRTYACDSLTIGYYDGDELQIPIENFREKMMELEIDHQEPNMDDYTSLYDRLYLGKKVSEWEIQKIRELGLKIDDGTEKETNIKKLIKKIEER